MRSGNSENGTGARRQPGRTSKGIGRLNPDQTLKASLRIILRRQAGHLCSYEKKVLADPDPETVHDMRVAARRLRAVLRIFRKVFRRKELRERITILSGLIRALGRVRDCDIIMSNLESLRRLVAGGTESAIDDLMRHQRELRAGHCASLKREVEALRSVTAGGSFPDVVRNPSTPTGRSLRQCVGEMLPALLREALSYRREVVAHPGRTKVLHEMRIAARPLRYLMESFEPAFGKPFSKRLKELKGFLDIAGELHDCDVLIGMLSGQIGKRDRRSRKGGPGADPRRDVRIARLLAAQRAARERKFSELRAGFRALGRDKFRKKLLKSVEQSTP